MRPSRSGRYQHLVDELGREQIQINTPFHGGEPDPGRTIDERRHAELLRFHHDLAATGLARQAVAGYVAARRQPARRR